VAPNAVELIEELVWHHDQPFGDSSAIPTYLLNQVTRGHVTVALCGDGGDELFAGYERFAAAVATRPLRGGARPLRAAAGRALALAPPGALAGRVGNARRFRGQGRKRNAQCLLEWVSFIDDPTRGELLEHSDDWAQREYADLWRSSEWGAPAGPRARPEPPHVPFG